MGDDVLGLDSPGWDGIQGLLPFFEDKVEVMEEGFVRVGLGKEEGGVWDQDVKLTKKKKNKVAIPKCYLCFASIFPQKM